VGFEYSITREALKVEEAIGKKGMTIAPFLLSQRVKRSGGSTYYEVMQTKKKKKEKGGIIFFTASRASSPESPFVVVSLCWLQVEAVMLQGVNWGHRLLAKFRFRV